MRFKKFILGLVTMILSCSTTQPTSPDFNAAGIWTRSGDYVMEGESYTAVTVINVHKQGTYESAITLTMGATTITIYTENGTWEATKTTVKFMAQRCLLYSQSLDSLVDVECQPPAVYKVRDENTIEYEDNVLIRGALK